MKQNKRRIRGWAGVTFAAIAFIALATAAFGGPGQPQPIDVPRPAPARTIPPFNTLPMPPRMTPMPMPRASLKAPILGTQACPGINLRNVMPGTRVPLNCLPHLPMRTTANTATPAMTANLHGRLRPMAATGATIDLTAGAGCGTSGALYSVGCSMTWQATNNTDWANSTYQDYQVAPNATTATAVGGTYANNASSAHVSTLSVQGTYAFFVYDTSAQVIISIVYVNTGAPFTIGVYQDPYHTQQAYQFDVASSAAAYIYLPNVSTTDVYVIYVMSTAVNSYCVYLTPSATPAPGLPSPRPSGAPNSLICNPTTSPGISAPSGTLALQWPLSTNYQAGTYSIVVYDKTAGATLGQVQVSLTGIQGYTFQLYPTPGAAPTPAAYSTPPTTTFAWDSAIEQSTAGIIGSVANQIGTAPTNGIYRMTVTDPDGQVVAMPATNVVPNTCTSLSNSAANCIVTGKFQFTSASPALNTPGNYPNNTWTMQLYAAANQELEASQYFQIKGYSSQTQFNLAGVLGTSATFGCCNSNTIYNVAGSMVFTNNANVKYPIAADPIKGIEYTTGPGATLGSSFTPPSNASGNGVTIAMSGCAGTYNTTGCSKTVVDSTGGSWTVTDYCSVANPAAPTKPTGSQCVLSMLPQSNTDLVPGASITVSGLTFYAYGGNSGWACYFTPCSTETSILPLDGLSWSSTSTSSPAWSQVYYGSANTSIIGTANAHYIGSATFPGNSSRNVVAEATSPPNLPWTGNQFYPHQFAQAEYQTTTPFQSASGREDVLVVSLTNCTGAGAPAPGCSATSGLDIGEVEITFPSGISSSQITVDPSEPTLADGNGFYVLATSGGNACQNTPPTNAICLNPGGTAYNAGGNNNNNGIIVGSSAQSQGQIWLDVPASQAAYIAQELSVQAYSTAMLDWQTLTADGHTVTPVVGGASAGTAVDSLSLQGLSLNSSLMATQFNPTTVAPGVSTTTYSLNFGNTSSAADPNPDPVDAIVIEQTTNKVWTLTGPSISGTGSGGWTSLSGTGYNPSGNTMEYWFGLCGANQYTNHATGGPPQSPPSPTNPTTAQPALGSPYCTAAQEQNAIAPGGTMTFNFSLADTTTGTKTFYVYAHGANGGGWSAPKTVTVTSTSETASAKFYSVAQGSTDASCSTSQNVAANTVAQVAKSPNCFIYEVSNTSSGAQNIGTIDLALPAYDINGLATSGSDWSLVGSPITQYVVLGRINAGTFVTTGLPAGCAINAVNTFNPTPGSTNGQIEVHGCTGFTPGTNIAVEFVANTPSTQSDSYLMPATIDGATSGLAWTGSDEITVAFSLGLSVSIDPSNPGPGNSHPSPACVPAQCSFSGTTLDFGTVAPLSTVIGTDVARATVVYEGATLAGVCPAGAGVAANTWQLEVSVSSNPSNELFTAVDEPNSTSGLTYAAGVNSFFNPSTSTSVLSCGNETSSTDYDTISSFKVAPIAGDTSAHIITVTYTLISN